MTHSRYDSRTSHTQYQATSPKMTVLKSKPNHPPNAGGTPVCQTCRISASSPQALKEPEQGHGERPGADQAVTWLPHGATMVLPLVIDSWSPLCIPRLLTNGRVKRVRGDVNRAVNLTVRGQLPTFPQNCYIEVCVGKLSAACGLWVTWYIIPSQEGIVLLPSLEGWPEGPGWVSFCIRR